MNRRAYFRIVAIVALVGTIARAQTASPNDQARFLAGMPVHGSVLESYAHGASWMEHASSLDGAWSKAEQRQFSATRAWASRYLGTAPPTVYYMFSGPDFLYANLFFPNAGTYILCGTEPVGAVPDLTRIAPDHL